MAKLNNLEFTSEELAEIHKNYTSARKSIDDKYAALAAISFLLNHNSIDYFFSGGTCLGIYRDRALIPWDDDIDIDIKDSSYIEMEKLVVEYARNNSFPYWIGANKFHPKIGLYINNIKVSLVKQTKGLIKRDYLYRAKYRVPVDYVFPAYNVKFKDYNVRLPKDPVAYLNHLYGSSWNKVIRWPAEENDEFYDTSYRRIGKFYDLMNSFQFFLSRFTIN